MKKDYDSTRIYRNTHKKGCVTDLWHTLFFLRTFASEIKTKGIMGCIMNGSGEMADADYGYVGAGKGRVSLYRKNECIEKNIAEEEAVEKLLALIEHDKVQNTH